MTGTPTLVCRRSGEVAAVGPEFCHLTGWRRDVLLGQAANLNLNTGNGEGPGPAPPPSGARPPLAMSGPTTAARDPDRLQPVFLAELLDDDSAVEFYEDFARLAFGDARGNVRTRYRLLKYRTGSDDGAASGAAGAERSPEGARAKRKATAPSRDRNETAVAELGDKDGKIDCCCCWTVKRDLFNLPMM